VCVTAPQDTDIDDQARVRQYRRLHTATHEQLVRSVIDRGGGQIRREGTAPRTGALAMTIPYFARGLIKARPLEILIECGDVPLS